MTTPTDLQLKLALAKELPELIQPIHQDCEGYESDKDIIGFQWRDADGAITDREWNWVVREVIKKLGPSKLNTCSQAYMEFVGQLGVLTGQESNIMSTWQQRAIAYFKTIGKEIV
jgi:hypothetical protein